MNQVQPRIPFPVAAWILLCAFLNCAGWGLSAIHHLDRAGYAAATLVALVAATAGWKFLETGGWSAFRPHKLLRRFRHAFPAAFLILAAMAFLGGILHAPNNYDGLAYRLPRILNWLAERQWHWIHTDFQRLNTRTCGFEWVSAPLILFSGTDRWHFIINAFSFLLLPGLTFSLLRRLNVKRRTAWHWMWILPAGYGYLLQAGSVVNDLFGAIFAVTAVDCALRARRSGRMGEVWLSVLSIALLTAAKASNLPLLLVWFVAFLTAWRAWLWRPLALAAIILPAVFSSFLPTAVLNQHYGHDWTGARLEGVNIGNGPAWLLIANNTVNYSLDNLEPPVFPWARNWNRLADRIIPPSLAAELQKHFETGAAHWELGEMQIEERAGFGFGATTLLLATVTAAAWARSKRRPAPSPPDWPVRLVVAASWMSLLFTMAKISLAGGARYLLPYYPLLLPALLHGETAARLTFCKWWRGWAFFGFFLAAMLLVISPARPLWPALTFLDRFGSRLGSNGLAGRLNDVYRVYAHRPYAFAPALELLPPDIHLLGVITKDDPETSLWRPFGSRRIVHVLAHESGDDLRRDGIKYILVKVDQLSEPWPDWLHRVRGHIIASVDLRLRAGQPPTLWHLVALDPSPIGGPSS